MRAARSPRSAGAARPGAGSPPQHAAGTRVGTSSARPQQVWRSAAGHRAAVRPVEAGLHAKGVVGARPGRGGALCRAPQRAAAARRRRRRAGVSPTQHAAMPPKADVWNPLVISDSEEYHAQLCSTGCKVVEAYSAWCGPCQSVLPLFRRLITDLEDRPLTFITALSDSVEVRIGWPVRRVCMLVSAGSDRAEPEAVGGVQMSVVKRGRGRVRMRACVFVRAWCARLRPYQCARGHTRGARARLRAVG